MNPFDRPARPPKYKPPPTKPTNPFDDGEDDITIEFATNQGNSPEYNTKLPITDHMEELSGKNLVQNNRHRPFLAHVPSPQPPPKPPKSRGTTTTLNSTSSPFTRQGENSHRNPFDDQDDYTTSAPPSISSLRIMNPFRSTYQPARQESPGGRPPSPSPVDVYASSSSGSDEEEEEEEYGDSNRTGTTSGLSTTRSSDPGIEMQALGNTPVVVFLPPEKKYRKVRTVRGKPACVDEADENQLIRFLISERGTAEWYLIYLPQPFINLHCMYVY